MKNKKLIPFEHDEQVAVIDWCNLMAHRYPCLEFIYAIPNGARTSISVARRLKAEGMKAGAPDLCLPFPMFFENAAKTESTQYHGLYVEMKRPGKTPSDEQIRFIKYLKSSGYWVEVCYSSKEAITLIRDYLDGELVAPLESVNTD